MRSASSSCSEPSLARSGYMTDGKGYNVELIALPMTGKLVILERKETKES
jgi:hypothetical protein